MSRPTRLSNARRAGALGLALVASGAVAQIPPDSAVISAFFHSTGDAFADDIARVGDLRAFGLNTWVPEAHTRAELDAWLAAAEDAGANVIFKFLGSDDEDQADDELNLDRFGRVCRMTIEAEDSVAMLAESSMGTGVERVIDPAARFGVTAEGDAGNALVLAAGQATTLRSHPGNGSYYWLRPCGVGGFAGEQRVDSAGVRHRLERIRVRLRVDEARGRSLAELRALDPSAVVARLGADFAGHGRVRDLRVSDFTTAGFIEFDGDVPFYRAGRGNHTLGLRLESTGLAALVVDRFRFENAGAGRLFDGEFDDEIARQAGACASPRCIRTYVNDEPEYAEWEAWRHVDSVITARLGRRAVTALYWAVDAEMVRRWALYVRPSEILIDPYPFAAAPLATPRLPADAPAGHGLPPYDRGDYEVTIRAALDTYAEDLEGARVAARLAGVQLWLTLQQHGIARVVGNPTVPPDEADTPGPSGLGSLEYDFRPPTRTEASVVAFMGLAHGARGFFHFLYKSLDGCGRNDCIAYVGLTGPRHERESDRFTYEAAAPLNPIWTDYSDRWHAARDLNGRLATLSAALAGWHVATAGAATGHPAAGVSVGDRDGTPARDVHLGVFRRAGVPAEAESRVLVVNRRTIPGDARDLVVRLGASTAERVVTDGETSHVIASLGALAGSFSITLEPGDARLLVVRSPGTNAPGRGAVNEPTLGEPRPNPVARVASIPLALPTRAAVRVEVADVLGRHVATIHDGILEAGYHDLRWDVAGAASGLYFVRAIAGGRVLTRSVTVGR